MSKLCERCKVLELDDLAIGGCRVPDGQGGFKLWLNLEGAAKPGDKQEDADNDGSKSGNLHWSQEVYKIVDSDEPEGGGDKSGSGIDESEDTTKLEEVDASYGNIPLDYDLRDELPTFPNLKASANLGCEFCNLLLSSLEPTEFISGAGSISIKLSYHWGETLVEDKDNSLLSDTVDEPFGLIALVIHLETRDSKNSRKWEFGAFDH